MSLAAEDEPEVHRLHGHKPSMDVDEETHNAPNISGLILDAPESNISTSPLLNQADVKETSSYGKSSFVLPVTFFDIQSNLILLNECYPLAIKVVDCDKHPWYYKNYLRSDIRSESAKMTEDAKFDCDLSNNNISQNFVSIDLTETKYDKFEKIEANKVEKDKSRKSKETNKKRAHYVDKTKQTTNRRRNEMINNALSKIDLTNIDFKKNVGLIGLKITYKAGVLDNHNEQNEPNAMPSIESSDKQSTSNSTEREFMSGVDKTLCNLGTTIIPIFETQNVPRSSDTKILEDASIRSEKPLTKSATIVQISKKKLSKKAFYKIKPGKKSAKKNLLYNNDNSFGVGNDMNAKVQCQDNQPLTSPLPCIKEYPNNQCKKNLNVDKIKDVLKRVEKELTNVTKKSNAQLLEAHDVKTKNTEINRDNKLSSKSPILSCQIYKGNKLKSHSYLQPMETNQPYKLETKGEKADSELGVRNSQVKLVRDLGKNKNPRDDAKKPIEGGPQDNANIRALHHKHASAVTNTSQNVTKNVGHIGPIDMNKFKFNNSSKSKSTCNTNDKNEIKPAYKHQYTPSPYLLSKQNDTSKPQDGTNENTILLFAVQTDKKISLQNNVALSQPKQPPVENVSESNTNIQRVNCENISNIPCRAENENNLANVPDNNNQQIRHVLPLQIQSSERGNNRKGEPSRLPNIFPKQRMPPLVSHQVSPDSPVLYNINNVPRPYELIPNFYQKNMQQNLPQNVHIPNVNTNPYWSYWYHTHVPPPPLPPPPPPPPPPQPQESLRQVRRAEASNIINDSNQFNERMKNVGLKIKSLAELTIAKPVTSKNEMYQELEKETLKINSNISGGNIEKEIQSFPSTTYSHVNIQIPVAKQTFRDKDKKPHTGSNDVTKSQMHQVANLFHIDPSQWKGENDTRLPKNDSHPNKEHITANSLSKDHVQVNIMKTLLHQPDKSHKTETPKHMNRTKVGPLCMKNKTGPFAGYQTPPRSLSNSQPNMGYSPPILPIPTFEKSLEMLSQTIDLKRRHGDDRKSSNIAKTLRQESDKVQTKSNLCDKRIEFFYVDNEEKSLKKISLQDYKKRMAKGDDKCIVLKKHNSCKRAKRNQSSDQDLGYDSDVTVKL